MVITKTTYLGIHKTPFLKDILKKDEAKKMENEVCLAVAQRLRKIFEWPYGSIIPDYLNTFVVKIILAFEEEI